MQLLNSELKNGPNNAHLVQLKFILIPFNQKLIPLKELQIYVKDYPVN